MPIDNILTNRMRNNAYFQFHTEFKNAVESTTAAVLKIESLFQVYLERFDKMDAAYKNIVKSPLTEPIHEADKARDLAWVGFTESVRIALRHFDPAIQEAARRVRIVIKTYGKISRIPLMEQTAAVTNILQEFEGSYASDVAAMGLTPWIVELKARNIEFINLVRERVSEASKRVRRAFRKARTELDETYHEIVKLINALVVVEGAANYEDFINKFNIIISEYVILIAQARRKSKKDEKLTTET